MERKSFGGIHYLNNLRKTLKEDIPELSLLEALEQQKLQDFEKSEAALNDYEEKRVNAKLPQHPLYILAEARQILCKDQQCQQGVDMLVKFANTYPDAVDNWYEDGEKQLLLSEFKDDKADKVRVYSLRLDPLISEVGSPCCRSYSQ